MLRRERERKAEGMDGSSGDAAGRLKGRRKGDLLGAAWETRLDEARQRRAEALAARGGSAETPGSEKPWGDHPLPETPRLIDETNSNVTRLAPSTRRPAAEDLVDEDKTSFEGRLGAAAAQREARAPASVPDAEPEPIYQPDPDPEPRLSWPVVAPKPAQTALIVRPPASRFWTTGTVIAALAIAVGAPLVGYGAMSLFREQDLTLAGRAPVEAVAPAPEAPVVTGAPEPEPILADSPETGPDVVALDPALAPAPPAVRPRLRGDAGPGAGPLPAAEVAVPAAAGAPEMTRPAAGDAAPDGVLPDPVAPVWMSATPVAAPEVPVASLARLAELDAPAEAALPASTPPVPATDRAPAVDSEAPAPAALPVTVAAVAPAAPSGPIADAGPLAFPAAVFGGTSVDQNVAPAPGAPEADLAPSVDPVAPAPDAAPAPAVPQVVVHVHAPATVGADALTKAVGAISGVTGRDPSIEPPVDFKVTSANVRYFHAEDREAAAAVADALSAKLKNFTAYTPAPEPGTIEVWLAGAGTAKAVAKAPKKSAPKRTAPVAVKPVAPPPPTFETTTITRTRPTGVGRIFGR